MLEFSRVLVAIFLVFFYGVNMGSLPLSLRAQCILILLNTVCSHIGSRWFLVHFTRVAHFLVCYTAVRVSSPWGFFGFISNFPIHLLSHSQYNLLAVCSLRAPFPSPHNHDSVLAGSPGFFGLFAYDQWVLLNTPQAPQAQNTWCMRQLVYIENCMGK